jgi:MYXO-CTERM domain-containing protein
MNIAVTLVGSVLDILTNQPIPGVHVFTRTATGLVGTTTDPDGMYMLTVTNGALVELQHVSYTGEAFTASILAPGSVHYLEPRAYELPIVTIYNDPPATPPVTAPPPPAPPAPPRSNAGLWGALILAGLVVARAMRRN